VLESGPVKKLPGQAEEGIVVLRVDALVAEVVDGEDGRRLGELAEALLVAEVDGDQGARPVVGVDDIGYPGQGAAKLEGRAREEGEALGIVREIGLGPGPIDPVPPEKTLVLQEVDRNSGIGKDRFVDGGPFLLIADGHAQGLFKGRQQVAVDRVVAGEDDPDIVSGPGEGAGEGGDRVGQAARLREGHRLARDHEDLHATASSGKCASRGALRSII
jgi:hypothetical protein